MLVACAFAAAMIPRDRRAVNPEDEEAMRTESTTTSTTEKPKEICAPQTPCAWSIYKPFIKMIDFNFTNTYCDCGPGTVCQITEDDGTVNAYVYRCRPPVEDEDELLES